MNTSYLDNYSDLIKKIQAPLQELSELNLKTIQSLHYVSPDELLQIKTPTAFYEKQLTKTIDNSHKVLEHIQKSFQIIEKSMLSIANKDKRAN